MLGDLIKENREKHNLSQNELAELVGARRQSVCDWEKGRCSPNKSRLLQLSNLFNIPVAELLEQCSNSSNDKTQLENVLHGNTTTKTTA